MLSTRGLSIVSVAFNPVTLKEEDAEAIRQAQNTSMYTDPSMMAATLGMPQAEAMKNAASNPNGAMMGFMGMNMASGGMNIQGLYDQGAAQKQAQQEQQVQKEQNQANGQNPQAVNPNLKTSSSPGSRWRDSVLDLFLWSGQQWQILYRVW